MYYRRENYTTSDRVMKVREYYPNLVEGIVEAERYKREIASLNANIARLQHYLDGKNGLLTAKLENISEEEKEGVKEGESEGKEKDKIDDVEAEEKLLEEKEKVLTELRKNVEELRKAKEESAKVVAQIEKEYNDEIANVGTENPNEDSDLDSKLKEIEEQDRVTSQRYQELEKSLQQTLEQLTEKSAQLHNLEQTFSSAREGLLETQEAFRTAENSKQELESATKDIGEVVDAKQD